MRTLLSKIHPSHPPNDPNTIFPPTPLSILRYRYHHGTNLGSIFLLEHWLFPALLPPPNASLTSELSLVSTSLHTHGLAHTKQLLTQHHRSALSDGDFKWLVHDAKVTTIRLPIGYWVLGPGFCKDTDFEGVADVYEDSWGEVKRFINRARGFGVGVLIDIHGLPGGANTDGHSGTDSGVAGLWNSKKNLERAREVCVFVARDAGEGLVGVQVVNEVVGGRGREVYRWYEEVIGGIGEVNGDVPVYVSDGWDLDACLRWVGKRGGVGSRRGRERNPVVVDTHRYYTFTERDQRERPGEIIERVKGELKELEGKEGRVVDRGEAQVIVGEWSCVMSEETWAKVRPEEREAYTREFGLVQSRQWQARAGGSYFWTMKMSWMDGGAWGFVEQTKKGNIPPPPWLLLSLDDVRGKAQAAQDRRAELAETAQRSHNAYWAKMSPEKRFEHHLYGEGWEVGFSDALAFFTARAEGRLEGGADGGDKIGLLEIWVKKRVRESGERGRFAWEWEHGIRGGVAAFYKEVGI